MHRFTLFLDVGFTTGGTTTAVTQGIMVLVVDHPTKENHKLVLLDSEGLGENEVNLFNSFYYKI